MNDLLDRLCKDSTRVTFRARRGDARAELKEAIDRRYVHVLFAETQGGTELGFKLDDTGTDLADARWEQGEGTVRLAGDLSFDGVPLRCVAEIDLASVEGTGRLEVRETGAAG